MNRSLQIKFRKMGQGPEAELVNNFLNSCSNMFDSNLEYQVLTEVYAELGIPDVLIVAWEKEKIKKYWSPERSKLSKDDIKILHYVTTFRKRGVLKKILLSQLGYEETKVEKCMLKLKKAKLINYDGRRIIARAFDEIFFLKEIIAIEAKITNWKVALQQAKLNENFASHTYVLLPEQNAIQRMISSPLGKTGVIAQNGDSIQVKKKAKKTKLPGSYFSWILNEFVGNQIQLST